ncbi:hypothetical protein SESBI_40531 [Sesbania bispinosa]|nr:hypothetical protein SESBI_40531 [Sesbania bispinosa]
MSSREITRALPHERRNVNQPSGRNSHGTTSISRMTRNATHYQANNSMGTRNHRNSNSQIGSNLSASTSTAASGMINNQHDDSAQPIYKARPTMVIEGVTYYAFRASLRSPLIGQPHSCVGAYAPDEDLAREDVARKLLRRMLIAPGKDIGDYNYYHVTKVEEKMRAIKHENEELKMEIGFLKEQMAALNFVENQIDFTVTSPHDVPTNESNHPNNTTVNNTNMPSWMEEMNTRLSEIEKAISKVLFVVQYAMFQAPDANKKKLKSTPLSCPTKSNAGKLDVSDYEDLADFEDEEDGNIMLDVSTEDEYTPWRGKRSKGKKAKQTV